MLKKVKVNSAIDFHMNDIILDLQILIRQPSVSSDKQDLVKCALLVVATMNEASIKSELIYLTDFRQDDVVTTFYGVVHPMIKGS